VGIFELQTKVLYYSYIYSGLLPERGLKVSRALLGDFEPVQNQGLNGIVIYLSKEAIMQECIHFLYYWYR
jgi:hypothetical protein